MTLLFFVYGLAFFALGLVLLTRRPPTLISTLKPTHLMVGLFALLHAVSEWLVMGKLISGNTGQIDFQSLAIIVGGVSFVFLGVAARGMVMLAWPIHKMMVGAFVLVGSIAWFVISGLAIAGKMEFVHADVVARWLLGGPSAIIIGFALITITRDRSLLNDSVDLSVRVENREINQAFQALAFSGILIGLYGLTTFFGAKLDVFPFAVINLDTFALYLGFEPPLLRTILTVLLLMSFLRFVTRFSEFERRGMESEIASRTRDLVKANHQLGEAYRNLEDANATKSMFLATMSHELRTPLNAILGFSDILAEQYFGPPGSGKYREYAKDIRNSGEHLLELINDLLDISAIEAGKRELNIDEISMEDLIGECCRVVHEKAKSKGMTISVDLAHDSRSLRADSRGIKQILLNLLSNAIKYTQEDGEIVISTEKSRTHFCLTIRDDGIGMTPEQVDAARNPYIRGVNDPLLADKGWGLGLSIVSSLVEIHAGELDIRSETGKGTKVLVRFPLEPGDAERKSSA